MLTKISKNSVDITKYKSQMNVRRTVTGSRCSYDSIAVMTDADADG